MNRINETNDIELPTFTHKIIIIGDHCVGKSTLLTTLIENKFINNISTIGVDMKTKTVIVDDINIKLNIWDTAGQERFRNIVSTFYRHAHAIMIVYDITNAESFESIHLWLNDCVKVLGSNITNIPIVLVGNKSDLIQKREVEEEYAKEVANNLGFILVETSAKNIESVNEAFITIARMIKNKYNLRQTTICPSPIKQTNPYILNITSLLNITSIPLNKSICNGIGCN